MFKGWLIIMKKINILFILGILFLFTSNANATIINNLRNLSSASYALGSGMLRKKQGLAPDQAYTACKFAIKGFNTRINQSGNKMESEMLYYMSPAEVTYCWVGYINDGGSYGKLSSEKSVNNINGGAYIMGESLYNKNPGLSTKSSYLKCKSRINRYNSNLAIKYKTNAQNVYNFLYMLGPSELTYCWVGYLDAAGAASSK